jgi:hypothetical protein
VQHLLLFEREAWRERARRTNDLCSIDNIASTTLRPLTLSRPLMMHSFRPVPSTIAS